MMKVTHMLVFSMAMQYNKIYFFAAGGDRMNNFRTTLEAPNIYDEELSRLIQSVSVPLELKPKEIFASPYINPESMFFIQSGKTKHYFCTDNGAVKVLFFLCPGWIFGETTYFMAQETGIYSQAHTDCLIYKFDAATCSRLLQESDLFRRKLMECLSKKTLLYRTEIENLAFIPAKDRLKSLFCSMVMPEPVIDGNWLQLRTSCTHSELGEIIGTTRVTISRLISELSREKFCRNINHAIQINRAQYLEFMENAQG